jgi:hypothetical protein
LRGRARACVRNEVTSLRVELKGRPHERVSARLGYLLEGVPPHLVEEARLRPCETVTHIGPRDASARYSARWNVADSEMPVLASWGWDRAERWAERDVCAACGPAETPRSLW